MAQPSAPTGADQIDCPSCGRANSPGFRFCGNCGAALDRTCPSCGSVNPASSRFCGNCGSALEPPARAEAAPIEERKVVTVLFADLTASTELAARMDPEDLRGVLQPFFSSMAAEVGRFGGTVEKFIGDAVVAVFGAPTAHEDDPERAVRAAMAMHRRLEELNAAQPGGITLEMRVGVNTGEVMAAAGTERHGMITGEAVNVAARLQGASRPGAVLVGERTYRVTRHLFEYRAVGEVAVKGLDRPLPAWEAVTETQQVARPGLFRAPLIGRASELELLRLLLFRTARERTPNLVTVVGPAGIGKTRLTQEFVDGVDGDRRAARVVRGRCLPYGDGLTYWPLAEILKSDAGILDSDTREVIRDKAGEVIEPRFARGEEAPRLTRVLLSSIGIEVEADPLADTAVEVARQMIARSWRLYLESLAVEGSVVALIEDLHWADPGLLDLIEHLAGRATAPLLLLCTARPELSERRPAWGGGVGNSTTMALPPLTEGESETLVRELLGEGEVDEEAIHAVLERAEGTPFFAEELVRMMIEEGVLVRRGRTWSCEGGIPATLPDTVQGVIAARIDLLPAEEKRAIQDAAVVGRTFWQGAVERLGSSGPALDAIAAKGLVWEREGSRIGGDRELTFNHVLTRDVAYQSIPKRRRNQAHAEAVAWFEEAIGGRREEFAEILAHHSEDAGDMPRSARYSMLAGNRKLRVFAADEAIRWYDQALDAAAGLDEDARRQLTGEIFFGRGRAREQLAMLPEARSDYERSADAALSLGDEPATARAEAALAHVLRLQSRLDEGRAVAERALARARRAGADELVPQILYTAGACVYERADWEEAITLQEEALGIAVAAGDLEGEALALHGLADIRFFTGPVERGIADVFRAQELLAAVGNRPMWNHNEHQVGWLSWLAGRFPESLEAFDRSVAGDEEIGDRWSEVPALSGRAHVHLAMAAPGPALADAREAVRLGRAIEAPRLELIARSCLMDVLAELHLFDAIELELAAAQPLSDHIGPFWRPRLVAYRAWLRLRRGDADATAGLEEARAAGEQSLQDALWVARTELLAGEEAGDPALVEPAARRLVERAATESPTFAAWGRYGLALSGLLGGNAEGAVDQARDALAAAEGIGERSVEWRAAGVLARALEAEGRNEEADAPRARAGAILQEAAGGIEDEALKASFLSRPDVAAILSPA